MCLPTRSCPFVVKHAEDFLDDPKYLQHVLECPTRDKQSVKTRAGLPACFKGSATCGKLSRPPRPRISKQKPKHKKRPKLTRSTPKHQNQVKKRQDEAKSAKKSAIECARETSARPKSTSKRPQEYPRAPEERPKSPPEPHR